MFTQNRKASGVTFVRSFDRLILLQRRDKLAQAVSLARAVLADQWMSFGDGARKPLTEGDGRLMPAVANAIAEIIADEAVLARLVADVDPSRIRRLHYEHLNDAALESAAAWLWEAASGRTASISVDSGFSLPRKLDRGEAVAIKRQFLRRIGTR